MKRTITRLGVWLGKASPRVIVWLLLGAFALSVLFPLVWIMYSSLKSNQEIAHSPWGWPQTLQWGNFAKAWNEAGIGVNFVNSAIVTVCSLAILLPVGAMASYVFAHYPFRGSKLLFGTFIGGMMIPLCTASRTLSYFSLLRSR